MSYLDLFIYCSGFSHYELGCIFLLQFACLAKKSTSKKKMHSRHCEFHIAECLIFCLFVLVVGRMVSMKYF